MSCPLCTQKLTRSLYPLIGKACGPCHRQLTQMMAGFHGIITESRPQKTVWDNTTAYQEWLTKLDPTDTAKVGLSKKDDYIIQRCDLRDMKRVVGLPKWLPLEDQVYTAWVNEGQKDARIQEVLGLTYSQLFHVKKVIQVRLKKQMLYFRQIKKLEKEGEANGRI